MSLLVEAMLPGSKREVVGLTSAEKSHEVLLCPQDGDVVRTVIGERQAYAVGGYLDHSGEARYLRSDIAATISAMDWSDVGELCKRAADELGIGG
jgi:hypothetical protein